jgi:FSR family fosmidomycin resistance protein-like MFS transporter
VGFSTGHGAVCFPFGAMWLLAPAIATSYGLSPTQIGYLFTGMILGSGFTHIPAALIGETHLRQQLLPLTLYLVAACYFLGSGMGHYLFFFTFMVMGAVAAAAWHPVAMGVLTEQMPNRKAFALGIHFIGGSVAEVIAPITVGFVLAILDWRQVMQGTILPALILGTVFLRMAKYVQLPSHGSFRFGDIKLTLGQMGRPVSVLMFLVLGFHSMGIMGLFTMVPLYLQSERGFSPSLTGSLFSLMILLGAVGAPVLGTLTDSRLQRKVIFFSLLGSVGATLVIVFGTSLSQLIIGIILIGFLLLGLRPSLVAMLLGVVRGRHTTVMGIVLASSEIVGAFGSLLSGMIGSFDLSLSILLVGGLAGLSALLLCVLPSGQANAPEVI